MESEQEVAERIGAAIRKARQARRWTQATLAEQLGLSVTYIGIMERGEKLPSLPVLRPPLLAVLAVCGLVLGTIGLSGLFPMLGAVCFIGSSGCGLIYIMHPVKFWVRIGAASGETNACWYKRREEAQRVVDAINDAIVARG